MGNGFFTILQTVVTGILCVLCLVQMCIIKDIGGQFKRLDDIYATKESVAIYRGELASNNTLCDKMIELLAERGINHGN